MPTTDWRRRTQALTLAVLTVLVATPLAFGAHILLPHANLSLLYLTAVLITAGRAGMEAAIYASLLSFLCFNFFFTQPLYSLEVHDDGEVATLLFFLLMAALTGKLAARMQQEVAHNRVMVERLTNINRFTRSMASAPDTQAVQHALARHIAESFHTSAWVVLFEADDTTTLYRYPADDNARQPDIATLRHWLSLRADGLEAGLYRFILRTPNGANALLLLQRERLTAAEHELARMLCDLAATTLERVRLVDDLEEARFVSETEQLRSALLSSVSHDLRTPLASIIGSTSTLIEYPQSINEEEQQELLQMVLDESQRLNRYIQNLLDMTRLGGGRLILEREWADINDIIGSAVERLHKDLQPLQVEIVVDEGFPLLYVQAVLIEQALVNVLDNAARFSPPGETITLHTAHDEKQASITVCDQGPGIPPDQRERVFDMFYTVQGGDRQRQGTGLGLAICRGMLNAHGGEVEVLSGEAGRGTCIRLTLPLHQTELNHDPGLTGHHPAD